MTTVAVFGSSTTTIGSADWEEAERLGRAIADRGWTVATGGYGGTMEAVSAGAAAGGGTVIGITAPDVFPGRSGANRHVTHERPAPTLVTRIGWLVEQSDAVVALPGSVGTMAELVVAWNVAYVATVPRPVVAVGGRWRDMMTVLEASTPSGRGLVDVVEDTAEALAILDRRLTAPD